MPLPIEQESAMDKAMHERGMQMRRAMSGEKRVAEELSRLTSFDTPLQELVTTYCFGEVWGREGLSKRDRSMITVAMLIALNRQIPLKSHFGNALTNGVTKDELMELVMHACIYCGVPAAADANRIAKEVLAERGLA
jgi:4-carboxymuconolactone decarboxylase